MVKKKGAVTSWIWFCVESGYFFFFLFKRSLTSHALKFSHGNKNNICKFYEFISFFIFSEKQKNIYK